MLRAASCQAATATTPPACNDCASPTSPKRTATCTPPCATSAIAAGRLPLCLRVGYSPCATTPLPLASSAAARRRSRSRPAARGRRSHRGGRPGRPDHRLGADRAEGGEQPARLAVLLPPCGPRRTGREGTQRRPQQANRSPARAITAVSRRRTTSMNYVFKTRRQALHHRVHITPSTCRPASRGDGSRRQGRADPGVHADGRAEARLHALPTAITTRGRRTPALVGWADEVYRLTITPFAPSFGLS